MRRYSLLVSLTLAACGGGSKINVPANDPTPPSAVALQADVPGKRLVNVSLGSAPDGLTLGGPDTVRLTARADDPDGGVKAIRIWMSIGRAKPGVIQNPTLSGAPSAEATSHASVGQPADVTMSTALDLDSPTTLGPAFHDLTAEVFAEAENFSGGKSRTAMMTLRMSAIPLHLRVIPMSDEDGSHAFTVTKAQFDTVVTRVNRVYRGSGVRFLWDSTNDWAPLSKASINRDSPTELADGNAIANGLLGKIVLFLRFGPDATNRSGNGHGFPPPGAGAKPSSVNDVDQRYISLPDTFVKNGWLDLGGGSFVAHEIGHYLGLYHTFPGWSDRPGPIYASSVTTSADADAAVVSFMSANGGTLAAFDGDLLGDTGPDPGATLVQLHGIDICTQPTIPVPGTSGSQAFTPPYGNVMSYHPFWNCSATTWPPLPQTFTPQQVARIHSTLSHPSRSHLVP